MQSLMGRCNAVLLDEPTSGLDPQSRRLLWDVLLAIFSRAANERRRGAESSPERTGSLRGPLGENQVIDLECVGNTRERPSGSVRSCVLTTHSLEEAEALCDRVAILLTGSLYALGITLPITLYAYSINKIISLNCITH